MMEKQELTMEQAMEALDHIVEQLEEGDASLEETFTLYQQGMELLKQCSGQIDEVEKKLQILNENGEISEI